MRAKQRLCIIGVMAAAPKIATERRQWDNAISKSRPIRLANEWEGNQSFPLFYLTFFENYSIIFI
jgi:hypothetical protein